MILEAERRGAIEAGRHHRRGERRQHGRRARGGVRGARVPMRHRRARDDVARQAGVLRALGAEVVRRARGRRADRPAGVHRQSRALARRARRVHARPVREPREPERALRVDRTGDPRRLRRRARRVRRVRGQRAARSAAPRGSCASALPARPRRRRHARSQRVRRAARGHARRRRRRRSRRLRRSRTRAGRRRRRARSRCGGDDARASRARRRSSPAARPASPCARRSASRASSGKGKRVVDDRPRHGAQLPVDVLRRRVASDARRLSALGLRAMRSGVMRLPRRHRSPRWPRSPRLPRCGGARAREPKVSLAPGPREYVASDYPTVLTRWTREESLIQLSELDDKLTVTATFESWDFRWAYVVRYAAGLPPHDRAAARAARSHAARDRRQLRVLRRALRHQLALDGPEPRDQRVDRAPHRRPGQRDRARRRSSSS